MIERRTHQVYEQVEVRFRQICLEDSLKSPHPVWRFMRKRDLCAVISNILDDISSRQDVSRSATPSIKHVFQELLQKDLLREVGEPHKDAFRIYWLTLRGGHAHGHNEFELVSSLDHEGVISHFSALVFHDLTDIRAMNHFLTIPSKRPLRKKSTIRQASERSVTSSNERIQGPGKGPRIGTLCFSNEGIGYRLRTVVPECIFGTLKSCTDDNERITVFGLEKAMIDAVKDPACNGGIRGMIEAWENGGMKIREQRLIEHLHRFDRESLWRRVGALADYVGRDDVTKLMIKLVAIEDRVWEPLPLVWQQTKGNVVKPWNVIVPW